MRLAEDVAELGDDRAAPDPGRPQHDDAARSPRSQAEPAERAGGRTAEPAEATAGRSEAAGRRAGRGSAGAGGSLAQGAGRERARSPLSGRGSPQTRRPRAVGSAERRDRPASARSRWASTGPRLRVPGEPTRPTPHAARPQRRYSTRAAARTRQRPCSSSGSLIVAGDVETVNSAWSAAASPPP